jgi:rhodanese-related sulfurtransferase
MNTTEITADTAMKDILEAYPGAQRALMRRFHIGGCSSCGFEPSEKLADVLTRHNVADSAAVIDHIKTSHEQEQKLQISPQELADALKGENPPRLVDVRSEQEYQIAKLEGSVLATQAVAQEMQNDWDKDMPIVTYCHHGMRSMEAASWLIGHGFTNVRSLTGGIDQWSEQIDSSVPRY